MKPFDTKLIMVVAQAPFTTDTAKFCKLAPLRFVDDEATQESDYPNDGEIWWMLTAVSASYAIPGRLVVGNIEDAVRFEKQDPRSSQYQVEKNSLRPPAIQECVELVAIPSDAINDVVDLANSEVRLPLSHTPTPQVLIEWRDRVIGPFSVERLCDSDQTRGGCVVTVRPHQPNLSVINATKDDFDRVCGNFLRRESIEYSLSDSGRQERRDIVMESYRFLLADGYDQFLIQPSADRITLEPMEQSLVRLAKSIVTRSKRRELRDLLGDISQSSAQSENPELLLQQINNANLSLKRIDDGIDRVVDSMMQAGLIDESRIEEATKRHVEIYIAGQSAEIQAELEERINAKKKEFREESNRLDDSKEELRRLREAAHAEIEKDKRKAREETESERMALEKQKTDLKAQEELLKQNLEGATRMFLDASDEVINRFLTIAPLLSNSGIFSGRSRLESMGAAPEPPAITERTARTAQKPFEIPDAIIGAQTEASERKPLDEDEFFARFIDLTKQSGFNYARVDLARFHLSVKCSHLTVVGGASGTGKSTLAMLYARALAGSEWSVDRPDFLMVNVNPSWMDVRDLLGHVNTLEGDFYPAETGLYRHLIFAQEEFAARNGRSAIYPVCLDEMNLAQVEHYFSDFMQVIERPLEQRQIRCFSPEVISEDCPFRFWPTIKLSPAARFIGTVNFDETTRRLSDRLLDRTNLITMDCDELPSLQSDSESTWVTDVGRRVTISDYQRWIRDAALPATLAGELDAIRKPLSQLGFPVSARSYRAICRYVASAEPIISQESAMDLQVTQRLLSRVRNLVTQKQYDALDELEKILTRSDNCSFDRSLARISEIKSVESSLDFNL